MEISGALLEASILNGEQAQSLSDLPTKEQTLAESWGQLMPSKQFGTRYQCTSASLVRVINAHVEKQKEDRSHVISNKLYVRRTGSHGI